MTVLEAEESADPGDLRFQLDKFRLQRGQAPRCLGNLGWIGIAHGTQFTTTVPVTVALTEQTNRGSWRDLSGIRIGPIRTCFTTDPGTKLE